MKRIICQKLLVCFSKLLKIKLDEIDLNKVELKQIRKQADGIGFIAIFDSKIAPSANIPNPL